MSHSAGLKENNLKSIAWLMIMVMIFQLLLPIFHQNSKGATAVGYMGLTRLCSAFIKTSALEPAHHVPHGKDSPSICPICFTAQHISANLIVPPSTVVVSIFAFSYSLYPIYQTVLSTTFISLSPFPRGPPA